SYLASRLSIAFERCQLRPAAVLPLLLLERFGQVGQLLRRLARPVQAEQLKDRFLVRFRFDLPQPPAAALDAGGKLLLAAQKAVMFDRMDRQRRGTDVARRDRGPGHLVEPATVRRLDSDQVMDHPICPSARRPSFGGETKQVVAEAVSRVRVKEGLEDILVLRDRVREFGERVDLFPGGLLIEADRSVAGVADGGHRQVLLVARRAVLFADVPSERLARSGCARLQCRQRLLGPSDYNRIIEVIGKSAVWRGDFFGEGRLFLGGGPQKPRESPLGAP